MKKLFVLLFAGAALLALCAFVIIKNTNALPQNSPETQFCHSGMKWVCISDDCGECKDCPGKCVINDIDRKCGKCGGFMESGPSEVDGKYLKSTYTCKKCKHSCVYKCKAE